jgi:1-deoxy-D-xylulose-5-phosphate reductoisomerase
VLNAANEVAVAEFLADRLGFTAIPHVIDETMTAHRSTTVNSLTEVRSVDAWAREYSRAVARGVQSKV